MADKFFLIGIFFAEEVKYCIVYSSVNVSEGIE